MSGEREWAIGQPITKALAARSSDHAFDAGLVAQEGEQRKQRQAEDREIVALDLLEELDAEPLELVGADARQRSAPARAR